MGLLHMPHTITYSTNGTALKINQKSNDAIHMVASVHTNAKWKEKCQESKQRIGKNM